MRRFLFLFVMASGLLACSTDTFTASDGGADASGDASDAGGDAFDAAACGATWCTTQPVSSTQSCTDFDESADVPKAWTLETSHGGIAEIVSSPAEACESLHANMPMQPGTPGGAVARITRTATSNSTSSLHATLELDVELPQTAPNGVVFLFGIRGDALTLGLAERADGTWWLESSIGTATLSSQLAQQGPVLGAFTHMKLDVTYQPSSISAELSYVRADNKQQTSVNVNGSAAGIPALVTFAVGFEAPGAVGDAVDAYYDQVVTTLQ